MLHKKRQQSWSIFFALLPFSHIWPHFVYPKSVISFRFISFLSPLYCDHFGDGIAGYGETEWEARQRRERRNERKDHITITEHYRMSV